MLKVHFYFQEYLMLSKFLFLLLFLSPQEYYKIRQFLENKYYLFLPSRGAVT